MSLTMFAKVCPSPVSDERNAVLTEYCKAYRRLTASNPTQSRELLNSTLKEGCLCSSDEMVTMMLLGEAAAADDALLLRSLGKISLGHSLCPGSAIGKLCDVRKLGCQRTAWSNGVVKQARICQTRRGEPCHLLTTGLSAGIGRVAYEDY
eukprot:2995765-Amphidinium_carterae.1